MIRIEEDSGGSALVAVKAVPGASRDEVAGALGERLKVRVSAAPEGGKANKAICVLLARTLGVGKKSVSVVAGTSSTEKTLRIEGMSAAEVRARVENL